MSKKITFIGVGNMAGAIIDGITSEKSKIVDWSDITLYDKAIDKSKKYESFGAHIAYDYKQALESADCIVLAVKPQNFPEVLPHLKSVDNYKSKLYITIAAGITLKTVSDAVDGAPVVRVLPNTPMLIGKGVSAICRNDNVTDSDFQFACNLFESAGSVTVIDESLMNRIICVTSSSPAYVFKFIDAMYKGAVAQGVVEDGLSEDDLLNCICDAIIGTVELMKSSDKTPDEQISTVASKGGTTERALNELDTYNFSEGIISAMQKCTDRADELSGVKHQ